MFCKMMNPDDFGMLPQKMGLGSHIVTKSPTVRQTPARKCHENEDNNYYERIVATVFYWSETPSPRCSSRRTEIQSKPLTGHGCTIIVQGKYERQAQNWQKPTGHTHRQIFVL
jgi:hypothetical protein